jgi:hypothetical protein
MLKLYYCANRSRSSSQKTTREFASVEPHLSSAFKLSKTSSQFSTISRPLMRRSRGSSKRRPEGADQYLAVHPERCRRLPRFVVWTSRISSSLANEAPPQTDKLWRHSGRAGGGLPNSITHGRWGEQFTTSEPKRCREMVAPTARPQIQSTRRLSLPAHGLPADFDHSKS